MTSIPKTLGEGQLPAVAADLVTAAAGKALLGRVTLFNVSGATASVRLWYKIGANNRQFAAVEVAAGEFAVVGQVQLDPGEALRGDASAATSIDWTFKGAEVTL